MLVVLAAEALRALDPFQLAVDDHGGVHHVKCAVLLKDVSLVDIVPSCVSTQAQIANMQRSCNESLVIWP